MPAAAGSLQPGKNATFGKQGLLRQVPCHYVELLPCARSCRSANVHFFEHSRRRVFIALNMRAAAGADAALRMARALQW
ncbi:hypothetical protein [Achromobacter anxifer]|uniref:hypothetical protein n=1 Tax=Achromobacter anxifer TaxID=1287737 RepID=UPI001590EC51|nr:hypothetical protein [Achromobacter anxifer]